MEGRNKWELRNDMSEKPFQNPFARMEKYETWPCSALINLWLWKLWWRKKWCGAGSELNQFLREDFYVPLCETERLFLSDFSFLASSLGVIYKNPALPPPPLASPTIRCVWLCSQLLRSKCPQPGLLTSSWFIFCMLLFACWSMPWDGAQLNEEKWKRGAMPDSFAAVLLIMKDERDSGQTDKKG